MTEEFKDNFVVRAEDSISIDIWIAGDQVDIADAVGKVVDEVGLCVTLTPTVFRYTNGAESGVRIGLRNYPRFPARRGYLLALAERIGLACAIAADQGSFMVEEVGEKTLWYSRRVDDSDITSGFVVKMVK
jgi:hypothetical protein